MLYTLNWTPVWFSLVDVYTVQLVWKHDKKIRVLQKTHIKRAGYLRKLWHAMLPYHICSYGNCKFSPCHNERFLYSIRLLQLLELSIISCFDIIVQFFSESPEELEMWTKWSTITWITWPWLLRRWGGQKGMFHIQYIFIHLPLFWCSHQFWIWSFRLPWDLLY